MRQTNERTELRIRHCQAAPSLQDDYASWVRAWKASVVGVFAAEIGSEIGDESRLN